MSFFKNVKPSRVPQIFFLECETFSGVPTVFFKNLKPSRGRQMFFLLECETFAGVPTVFHPKITLLSRSIFFFLRM